MASVSKSNSHLVPLADLHNARLDKTRQAMIANDTPILLILDAVNIRYITGASNMTIFSTRTPARYLLLFAEGPAILYDYFGCEHLSKDLTTIDQICPARGLCYTSSGGQPIESARQFATDIADAVSQHLKGEKKLAIDRFPYTAVDALREQNFELTDADSVISSARKCKFPMEITYMQEAMRRTEIATAQLEQAIQPDKSEAEVWAEFHHGLIGSEGEYVATRLMQSGENTFPYFQECGSRILKSGDLICLDTDALGYQGYAVDFSRTFYCGDKKPTIEQKILYAQAKDQLEYNVSLISRGASFEEIADKAWVIPDEYQDSRYYCIGHGLGMSGEFPNIPHKVKGEQYPINGVIKPSMVLCIESYIGSEKTGQGVKLEQQLLVTETGTECMSQYGFDENLMR